MGQKEDPSWEAYPDTILDIGDSPKLTIELRHAISVETRRAFKERGIGPAFAVITAYNPLGRDTDLEETSDAQTI